MGLLRDRNGKKNTLYTFQVWLQNCDNDNVEFELAEGKKGQCAVNVKIAE